MKNGKTKKIGVHVVHSEFEKAFIYAHAKCCKVRTVCSMLKFEPESKIWNFMESKL